MRALLVSLLAAILVAAATPAFAGYKANPDIK